MGRDQGRDAGAHMRREAAEAPAAFLRAAGASVPPLAGPFRALYTVARGSSDAAALVLAYEAMRRLRLPATSLPPSVFSLGEGVALDGALVIVVSQSGASDDLVRAARGARGRGATVVAITNVPGSAVEGEAHATIPIGAGPERAVPATKTVAGAVGAGLALIEALAPGGDLPAMARAVAEAGARPHPRAGALAQALAGARGAYVIGRDSGLGAAAEAALKLKECCAVHAEAYSASEVLHGPLQLAGPGLVALVLDAGPPAARESLDLAVRRLAEAGAEVHRMAPADVMGGGEAPDLPPAAAAALLLCLLYPVVLDTALRLGHDPDAPAHLAKVTRTT